MTCPRATATPPSCSSPGRCRPTTTRWQSDSGFFDRFFVNAEVSAQGHSWSTAAYSGDYVEKTVPSVYSDRGRTYDYEGTNRGDMDSTRGTIAVPDDDVAEPANGYLWNLAQQGRVTFATTASS